MEKEGGSVASPSVQSGPRAAAPLLLAMLASLFPLLCALLAALKLLPAPSGGRMWAVLVVFPASVAFAASYALSRQRLGGHVDITEAVRSAMAIEPAGWTSVLLQAANRRKADSGLAERCLVECAGASVVGSALFLLAALTLLALSG